MKIYVSLSKKNKKLLKYAILFILGCILIYYTNFLDVKAYTVSSDSIYTCDIDDNVTSGTYIYTLEGLIYTGYFGTTYQGVMSAFTTSFNAQIQQGHTYTLELSANTGDWRNININSIQEFGSIGSHCSNNLNAYTVTSVVSTYYKITITFVANSTANYSKLVIYNDDGSRITGITNFKIDSIDFTDLGNSDTSDIINNQQQNTQDIIENDKQNTQDVIDNNNSNTQDIIDNQDKNNEELKDTIDDAFGKDCKYYNLNLSSKDIVINNSVLYSDGSIISSDAWGISNYYQIYGGYTYNLTKNYKGSSPSIVFYDENKNYVTGISFNSQTDINFSLPENVKYFRITLANSISSGDDATAVIISSTEICTNKLDDLNQNQQATNDKLDDLNDSLNNSDTSGANQDANNFFNNFENNDFGLSDIITLPLTTIQSITSKSCTPLNLTLPFVNKTFELPCMTTIYSKFEPFYSIYQTITFGVISYWICVQIYAMVKGFKDPTKDEIEVMDL